MFTQHKSQYSEIIHEINLNYVPHLEELKAFFVCVCKSSEWDDKFEFSMTFHRKCACAYFPQTSKHSCG